MVGRLKKITSQIENNKSLGYVCGSITINGQEKVVSLYLISRSTGKLVNVNNIKGAQAAKVQEGLQSSAILVNQYAKMMFSQYFTNPCPQKAYIGRFGKENPSYEVLSDGSERKIPKEQANIKQLMDRINDCINGPMITASFAGTPPAKLIPDTQQRPKSSQTSDAEQVINDVQEAQNTSSSSSIERIGPGLPNLGNTCYLNAALQLLMGSEDFCKALMSAEIKKLQEQSEKELLINLQCFHSAYKEPGKLNRTVEEPLQGIEESMRNIKQWNVRGQQDTTEAINVINDVLEKSVDKEKLPHSPQSVQLFNQNNSDSSRDSLQVNDLGLFYPNPMLMARRGFSTINLQLPLEQDSINIPETFRKQLYHLNTEATDDGPIGEYTHFFEAPNELRIELGLSFAGGKKRVTFTGLEQSLYLDTLPEELQNLMNNGACFTDEYELEGIIVHTGPSLDEGHYYTFKKGQVNGEEKWIQYNNDKVISTYDDLSKVTATFSTIVTPYVLLYKKKRI